MPSPTWNYFIRLSPGTAKCNLCDRKFKFNTCVSNLSRHLLLKHKIDISQRGIKPTYTPDREIKVRKLIELVKEHNCLWDENSNNFGDKESNAKAWSTIASDMLPDMDPVIAARRLSERFCILKERFLNDKLQTGNGSSSQDFGYYNQLEFLNSAGNSVSTSCTATETENAEKQVLPKLELRDAILYDEHMEKLCDEDEHQEETLQKTTAAKHSENTEEHPSRQNGNETETYGKSYPRKETLQKDRMPEHKNPAQYSLQVNDVDKNALFILSIADDMRRVPAGARMHLKSDVMAVMIKLVQKYRYIAFENTEN